ncbi:TPA: hypothetical protein ACIXZO_002421 [Escherichia coli]
MNTGYTPVQGRGFVRPEKQNLQNFAEIIPVISGLIGGSETNIVNARALQMFDDDEKGVNLTYPPDGNQNMSIISESVFYKLIKTKSAPLPERPCEQLTCCEKIGSVQGDYINRGRNDHSCRITGKTKATRYGGPSTQATRYPQRMSIANNATFAAGGQCDQCAGLLVGCQPLGSIPRCCNSLRSIRLIQVANEVSPSALAASSSCALNSSGSRIWYGGDRFSNGVDMVITLNYYSYMVITIVLTITQKTTPRTVGAVTGRLTKPLTGVTIMAGTQHTQTHPDYSSISTLEACHG